MDVSLPVRSMFSRLLPQLIMHYLGLDICADTLIGTAAKRGVSGGQKRRVTTGMCAFPVNAVLGLVQLVCVSYFVPNQCCIRNLRLSVSFLFV